MKHRRFYFLVLAGLVSAGAVQDTDDRGRAVADRTEGFYKDLWMDSGARLSSRKKLFAAESLGLSYEYYAGKDTETQNRILHGTLEDANGVLLYPDGQPRFRMIYVNGGGATSHGKTLLRLIGTVLIVGGLSVAAWAATRLANDSLDI